MWVGEGGEGGEEGIVYSTTTSLWGMDKGENIVHKPCVAYRHTPIPLDKTGHVTSQYRSCRIPIQGMSHPNTGHVTSQYRACHIPIQGTSHPNTRHVASQYRACRVPIQGMSHPNTGHVASQYKACRIPKQSMSHSKTIRMFHSSASQGMMLHMILAWHG